MYSVYNLHSTWPIYISLQAIAKISYYLRGKGDSIEGFVIFMGRGGHFTICVIRNNVTNEVIDWNPQGHRKRGRIKHMET